MQKHANFVSLAVLVIFLLAGCGGGLPRDGETAEKATQIAQCLEDKGALMYGAFWCSHCGEQKKNFGGAAEPFIPYRECDANGENPVTEECLALGVENYPTWIFSDGKRVTGAQTLVELQKLTGCSDEELSRYTPESA